MAAPGIAGLHLVRFGTAADQSYFLGDFAHTYDQIVVNANIIAHMPAAMATFLAVRAKKPFFIDPQTHAFQHEVDHLLSTSKSSAGEIKRSWQRVIELYGDPIARVLDPASPRPVLPEDFSDNAECLAFCRRLMEFQNDELGRELATGPDAEYIKYVAEEEGGNNLISPGLIVAPYFFLNAQFWEQWLSVNLRCLQFTRQAMKDKAINKPLAAQVMISKEVLFSETLREQLINAYRMDPSKPELFLLWIDSFTEHELSADQLSAYVSFVEQLAANGSAVVNLYGGYFSVATARFGSLQKKLMGICHGLEYGESKPAVPISGGVPVAKFYAPLIHARLAPRVATRVIRTLGGFTNAESFYQRICDCAVCRRVIQKNPEREFGAFAETKVSTFWRSGKRVAMDFPTANASDLCAQHYMWCKHREYTESITLDALCSSLQDGFAQLKKPVGLEFVGHCDTWPEALKGHG